MELMRQVLDNRYVATNTSRQWFSYGACNPASNNMQDIIQAKKYEGAKAKVMQSINLRAMAACLVFGLAATFVQADDATYPPIFREAPVKRFNSTEHPRFDHIERELRNLVAQRGSHLRKNYFCASGFEFSDGFVLSIVLWKNKDEMLWWRGTTLKEEKERAATLWFSPIFELNNAVDDSNGQRVNLGTGGIYLSQAKAAREDCQKYGQQFVVQPLAKSKSKAK